jgi:aminoglycoside phosphotransferase (APT) family kinase protein
VSAPAEPRRSRPSKAALAWAAAAIGPEAKVVRVRPLDLGSSSTVHAIDVLARWNADVCVRLVLRHHDNERWITEEPDLAAREADALTFLTDTPVPTPQLVAYDPDGTDAGVPAVLMTRLDGRMRWAPPARTSRAWLSALAAQLPDIHAVQPSGIPAQRQYRPYNHDVDLTPPTRAIDRVLWTRAIERYVEGPPARNDPPVFIHRDFHAGNVLWRRGRVAGVIDWVDCCIGDPGADVGHCRHNLINDASIDAADRFLAAWQAAAGVREYDPWWDLVSIVDWLPDNPDVEWDPPSVEVVERTEALLARALAA